MRKGHIEVGIIVFGLLGNIAAVGLRWIMSISIVVNLN
jgi:hypothetical protein